MSTRVLSIKVYKEYWKLNDSWSNYYLSEPVGWQNYSSDKVLDVVCISEFIFKQLTEENQYNRSKLAKAVWDYGETMREIHHKWEVVASYRKLVESIINEGSSGK